jgi:GntP family gluconate:H+ symporter
VKEYLNLSVTETMKSWSICETIISFAGLGFALLASLAV